MQQRHGFRQPLFIVPQPQPAAGFLFQSAADKGAEADARHLQRILEGQENTLFRPLVYGHGRNVLPLEENSAAGHGIGGVAGNGIAQGGFAGTVGTHEHVGLVPAQGQIDAVENFLLIHIDVKIFNLQQCIFFHWITLVSSVFSIPAENGPEMAVTFSADFIIVPPGVWCQYTNLQK